MFWLSELQGMVKSSELECKLSLLPWGTLCSHLAQLPLV